MEKRRCCGCMKLKTQTVCEYCGFDERKSNAPHQLPMGTVLKEQYLVGRVLGQGGFGITYLGWDNYLDNPVAIKEYFPQGTVMRENTVSLEVSNCGGDESRFHNSKEKFLREAKMLARFSQVPEIVQVRNFFLMNNTAYIIMEFVEGITLKQYVQDQGGKLSAEETLKILRPVIAALCKVHKTGLVHRDISPDNIMMLPGGGAKLLDFGAVKDVGLSASVDKNPTKSTEAILKQGYAPIEQYQRRGALGPWTDVYALCATIYYCLTGEVPPEAPERLLDVQVLDLRGMIPGLTKEQEAALEHGLELRAEKRTQSMDQLYEELFAASAPRETAAEPEKTDWETENVTVDEPVPPRPVKKIVAGIVAALAVLAVGIGVFYGGKQDTAPEIPGESVRETLVSGQCGDEMAWEFDRETGALTVSGVGYMWDFNGSWMQAMGAETNPDLTLAPWNEYRREIKSVTFSEGVTSVGDNAFDSCENLTEVNWGGVETIGDMAFLGTSLTELNLPDSVAAIGPGAFMGTALKNVTFGAGLETIGSQAFGSCAQLESVAFHSPALLEEEWDNRIFTGDVEKEPPENLVISCTYGSYAWAYATRYGIPCITEEAEPISAHGQCGEDMTWNLYECGVLELAGSGEMDNYSVFPWERHYDKITLVYVSPEIETIAENAFKDCKTLSYLYFVESNPGFSKCWDLGVDSFSGTGLKQVELLRGTNFGEWLRSCESLEYIKICDGTSRDYESEIWIGNFEGCTSLQKLVLDSQVLISKHWYTGEVLEGFDSESVTVYGEPNGKLEESCAALNVPFVPLVDGCTPDEGGQCGDSAYWAFDRDKKTLVIYGTGATWSYRDQETGFYPYRDEIEHVIVSNCITSFGDYLFRDLAKVKDIDMSVGWGNAELLYNTDYDYSCLDTLGEGVFSGCASLEQFIVPGGVQSYGKGIFENCSSLRFVRIAWGKLPANTFAGCTSLEQVHFGKNTSFGSDVFGPDDGHDYTEHVTFHVWDYSTCLSLCQRYGIPCEVY